jgi:Holliday junction resolvase
MSPSRHGAGRFNARRDANEPLVVDALKAQGFNVERVGGKGFPDLVITKGGQAWFCEVKMPKGKLNEHQQAFKARWTGPPILVLRTVEDALRVQLMAMEGGNQ